MQTHPGPSVEPIHHCPRRARAATNMVPQSVAVDLDPLSWTQIHRQRGRRARGWGRGATVPDPPLVVRKGTGSTGKGFEEPRYARW
jgi:hypothetical protein